DAATVTVTANKTNAVTSQANTGSATRTTTLAPVAPTTIVVKNDLNVQQDTYLTAAKAGQVATASGGTGTTWEWTVTNATVTAGAGTAQITFTPTATGTVTLSVKSLNAALAKSAAFAVSRTALPVADATITTTSFEGITGSFATNGIAGNIASVPNAGTGATYTWTVTGGTADGGIVNTRSILFTPAAGAGGTTTLSCTVTNAAGNSVTTPLPGKVVRTCAVPTAPSTILYTGVHTSNGTIPDYMTLGSAYTYTAAITAGAHATGTPGTYDYFTYDWSGSVNTTIKTGAASKTITFAPVVVTANPATDATKNTLTVVEVNAAGAVSSSYAPYKVAVVAAPSVTGFTIDKAAITAGDVVTGTLAFSGGSATIIDSYGDVPSASIPAGSTTGTWTSVSANPLGTARKLTLRVTNAASDVAELSQNIDVAALPSTTSLAVATVAAYSGTAVPFGTSFKLTPTYVVAPATAVAPFGFEGQTASITPGNFSNPATGSLNWVTPAAGSTIYNLNVTSRNGKTVTVSGDYAANVTAVAISAITAPGAGTGKIGIGETVTLGGGQVSGAVDNHTAWTYTGTGSGFLSATTTDAGSYPTLLGQTAGTIILKGTAVTDPTIKTATFTLTAAAMSISAPVYPTPTAGDHTTAVTPTTLALVAGANNTTVVYSKSGGTATATVNATGVITPTTAGTVIVTATSSASTGSMTSTATVTFS
ncbi:MAG: hypothetical protein WCK63_16800, partial [Betaproteobacteria bacterium]